jgi:hypothetical protein
VRPTLGEKVSERRACRVLGQPRRTQRYVPKQADDEPALVKRMLELVAKHPRYGYRMICKRPVKSIFNLGAGCVNMLSF